MNEHDLVNLALLAAWGCEWDLDPDTPGGVRVFVPNGLPHGPIREVGDSIARTLFTDARTTATRDREDA